MLTRCSRLLPFLATLLLIAQPVQAQMGSLIVRVTPRETYIYADGQPLLESKGHYVTLSPGDIKMICITTATSRNRARLPSSPITRLRLTSACNRSPGPCLGPGDVSLWKGQSRRCAAERKNPAAFFVGHGDEFNNEFGWKQELIVPPGKHVLTVEHAYTGRWSTTVDVQANKRVVVDAYRGVRKTVDWPRGQQLQSLPRFHAGIASAQVAVQKVSGQFSASTTQINCGDSARLNWSSEGAAKTDINGGSVSASGDQTVQPKQTTDYKFTAAGAGGVYTSDATVNVNTAIPASLSVSPAEIRYHKIGDKVDQQGSATVTWSAANSNSASVDPFGSVAASGSRDIQATPKQTTVGPIDETVTYTYRPATPAALPRRVRPLCTLSARSNCRNLP